jgi:hypothetical protein
MAKAQGSSVVVGFRCFGLLGPLVAWVVLWVLVFFFFFLSYCIIVLFSFFCLVSLCILLVYFKGPLRFL